MDTIAKLFTDVLTKGETPTKWRLVLVKVLFKKCKKHIPDNYRPVSIVPILYKTYAKIILNRIETILNMAQTRDQAGFRAGMSTEDHLMTTMLMGETKLEAKESLWVAAVDFRKAFDALDRQRIRRSLITQGVHPQYVQALKNVCRKQTAKVQVDAGSRHFPVKPGYATGRPNFSYSVQLCLAKRIWDSHEPMGAR